MRGAEGAAKDVLGEAQTTAGQLLGPKGTMFPAQNVKSLILTGDTKQWEKAAPLILRAPGGEQMFADAVRQTLAEKATQSTKGLTLFYDNKVRPALNATKILKPDEINAIGKRLTAIENLKLPETEKIGLARRVILQAFAGYSSSLSARGGTEAVGSLVPLIPQ